MSAPIKVSIPHQLGRAEARRRIEAGFGKVIQQFSGSGACNESWEGDRLTFSVRALGQGISGIVDVLDETVTMEIELPGFLGMIANSLRGRLQKAGQLLLTRD